MLWRDAFAISMAACSRILVPRLMKFIWPHSVLFFRSKNWSDSPTRFHMPSPGVLVAAWILALIIDRYCGEYPNRWHPVVWMGHTIRIGEKIFLGRGARLEFFGGILLVLLIPSGFAL